jgi:DNA mismatch repair protein MutH
LDFDPTDRESVLRHGLLLESMPLSEVARRVAGRPEEWVPDSTKGSDGRLIESYFGITGNSDAGPDLDKAGIELKTVPMVPSRHGKASKERTVITMVNYAAIVGQDFAGSTLDLKTRLTLYVFFLWGAKGEKAPLEERRVLKVLLHDRSSLGLVALRTAYLHVQSQVRLGKAHELSEGDTSPVGACTKARDSRHLTAQPYSSTKAKPRAFAWRPAYTTSLYVAGQSSNREPQVGSIDELVDRAFERLFMHTGKTAENLRSTFAPRISPVNKSVVWHAVSSILQHGEENLLSGLRTMGITVKTTRVDPETSRPHEGTSFSPFSFVEVHQTPWDESDVLAQLGSILFVVFESRKQQAVGEAVLRRVKLWQASPTEIACLEQEYEKFRSAFGTLPPDRWPKASETEMLHVRPHTSTKRDQVPLPGGGTHVRSSFWLNQSFVQEVLRRSR